MVEQCWVLVVKVVDQPGALTAAAFVFSNRGVSLETILGSGITATTAENGRLILRFRATEHKKAMLLRVLQRLPQVLQISDYRYDDPHVRAIAVAKITALDGFSLDAEAVQIETIFQTADSSTVVLTGSAPAVDRVIEALRQQNLLQDVVLSAIAV